MAKINYRRYSVRGPWSVDDEASSDAALVESATLVDKRNGSEWREGAYRVTDRATGRVVGVWGGEVAWSDAARAAHDLTFAARHAGSGW